MGGGQNGRYLALSRQALEKENTGDDLYNTGKMQKTQEKPLVSAQTERQLSDTGGMPWPAF